jgi:MoxR-like ATPase
MFNIVLDYPNFADEVEIIKRTTGSTTANLQAKLTAETILTFQNLVKSVPVSDNVIEYAVKLVQRTRTSNADAPQVTREFLEWGAGPRASQYLVLGAKCHALLRGKFSPDVEDVQAVAIPVLRHRVFRNFKAEAEGISTEEILKKLF